MNKIIIQVPISKDLRDRAAIIAENLGFSSLQETIRIFLSQFAQGKLSISFEEKPVRLSAKAIKRYNKMIEDIDSGKVKLFEAKNAKELMDHLKSP